MNTERNAEIGKLACLIIDGSARLQGMVLAFAVRVKQQAANEETRKLVESHNRAVEDLAGQINDLADRIFRIVEP